MRWSPVRSETTSRGRSATRPTPSPCPTRLGSGPSSRLPSRRSHVASTVYAGRRTGAVVRWVLAAAMLALSLRWRRRPDSGPSNRPPPGWARSNHPPSRWSLVGSTIRPIRSGRERRRTVAPEDHRPRAPRGNVGRLVLGARRACSSLHRAFLHSFVVVDARATTRGTR